MKNNLKNNNQINVVFDTSENINQYISKESVNLIITSPPYPMIKMWDDLFFKLDPNIKDNFDINTNKSFNLMHKYLNKIWKKCINSVKKGGIICINIGDATRKIGDNFQLFSNRTKVIDFFTNNGCQMLPSIYWHKPANKPNKFLGSGMYPVNAYVTNETEHILIFRKGSKRVFDKKEQEIRKESAFFYHERNKWFSDIWKVSATKQNKTKARVCDAAFPYEIPFRLINMFSIKGDIILDPFLGSGTTLKACYNTGRKGIGFEIDENFKEFLEKEIFTKIAFDRILNSPDYKHFNNNLNINVKTSWEKNIKF